jgi:hypothetical protein
MSLMTRKTILLSIDEFIRLDVADYSQLRLKNPEKPKTGRPIDIGAIVYSNRMSNGQITSAFVNKATPVELDSLNHERVKFIQALPVTLIGRRPRTIKSYLTEYIKVFDWMDNNGFENFLCSEQHAYDAYLASTQELERRVKIPKHPKSITPRTSKDMQWTLRKVIKFTFPEAYSEITAGVIQLLGYADPKLPVRDDYLLYYWDINSEIFHKFSKQCFNNKHYPPLIKAPDFVSYYIPGRAASAKLDSPHCKKTKLPHFNYTTGNIRQIEQVYKTQSNGNYKKAISKYQTDKISPRNTDRLNMAKRALYAFVELFRILTTCNQSTLRNLVYEKKFDDNRNFFDNEFRDVKFRANNREVTLRLHRYGYQLFKKYLRLRKWILDDTPCKWLFFSSNEGTEVIPNQLRKQHTDNHHNSLKRTGFIFNEAKALQDTQLRAANGVYLRERGFSPKNIADNNNHSMESAERSYSRPTLEKQHSELGNYWEALGNLSIEIRNDESHSISSGSCKLKKGKKPKSIISIPIIEPDCSTPQGCLFCVYYVCHSDEEDIRKLLSVLFIVEEIRAKATDIEHADEIYNLLVLRINEILSQLRSKSQAHETLVEKIKNEVFTMCELTPFWKSRLNYYEELGLIAI